MALLGQCAPRSPRPRPSTHLPGTYSRARRLRLPKAQIEEEIRTKVTQRLGSHHRSLESGVFPTRVGKLSGSLDEFRTEGSRSALGDGGGLAVSRLASRSSQG